MSRISRRAALAVLHLIPVPAVLHAQEFPSRPIKIVVGFGPGAAIEVSTRLIADLASKELGQPVLVENKPGAATMIAAKQVAQAPKDGYTLLLLNIQQYNNPLLFRNVSYKPSDFTPIIAGGLVSLAMATAKSLPVKNVREFIALVKANPGKLNYGYAGAGGSPQLMATRLEQVNGIQMQGVAYKDLSQITTDLVSERIHLLFTSAAHGLSMLQAGHANILAVSSPKRLPMLPDVATFSESGIEGMPAPWWGYAAPAGTPPAVIARLERAFRAAMATPRYQEMLVTTGSSPLDFESPAKFAEFIERETERWAVGIRALNLPLE